MPHDSSRTLRIGSDLQRDLAQLIHQLYPQYLQHLFAITSIKVAPDLSVATVYCSCMETTDLQPLLDQLQHDSAQIRHRLARVSPLKKFPRLNFHADQIQSTSRRIDHLLRRIGTDRNMCQ